MLTVNIPHVLVFYEHAMLFLLELLFQGYPQYGQFRGSLISFVHASFVEEKLVFWSNIQVFGSTCGSHGSNQYQGGKCYLYRHITRNTQTSWYTSCVKVDIYLNHILIDFNDCEQEQIIKIKSESSRNSFFTGFVSSVIPSG